jgi:hypothetical protein
MPSAPARPADKVRGVASIGRSARVYLAISIPELAAQIPSNDVWLYAVAAALFIYYLIAWFTIGKKP